MNNRLPDVAMTAISPHAVPLNWVGMSGIKLPIYLDEGELAYPVHATLDAQVDLMDPQIKGIHMSRIFQLLDNYAATETLNPLSLKTLLTEMVNSQADSLCHSAHIVIQFEALRRRTALVTVNLAGWRSYPIVVEAKIEKGRYQLQACVKILYSSTCPCSAALVRQTISEAFDTEFKNRGLLSAKEVADWLDDNATRATPHSQRSEAKVTVLIDPKATSLQLFSLIDEIEAALGTAVQTAVKRADEKAFAQQNGSNLMYVEDAARAIKDALSDHVNVQVQVRHLESLHAHDAIATAGSLSSLALS